MGPLAVGVLVSLSSLLHTVPAEVAAAQAPVTAAPAPAPAAAPAPAPTLVPFASIDKGMGIGTADGDYVVGVHLLTQLRYDHVEAERTRATGFRIAMVRPALRGAVFRKWITYFMQWEVATTSPGLIDAEVSLQPLAELGLTVGQFLTPFSREFLVPPPQLLLPDYAPSNVFFRHNRDPGAMLKGALFDERLSYWAGVFNGNGVNRASNDNAQLAYVGRLAVNALGRLGTTESPALKSDATDLTFGVNGSWDETEQTASSFDPATGATTVRKLGSATTAKLGADATFHTGPMIVQIEGYARSVAAFGATPRRLARGGFVQAGVFVLPRVLELAARGDLVDIDATRSGPLDARVDVGLNWYVREQHMKLQLRYAWADSPNGIAGQVKGISNTVTTQAQLWF